jgi:hypothetical protein
MSRLRAVSSRSARMRVRGGTIVVRRRARDRNGPTHKPWVHWFSTNHDDGG